MIIAVLPCFRIRLDGRAVEALAPLQRASERVAHVERVVQRQAHQRFGALVGRGRGRGAVEGLLEQREALDVVAAGVGERGALQEIVNLGARGAVR